jgi:hypothetical protein
MRNLVFAGAVTLLSSVALAQQPANPAGETPAVTTPDSSNPTAPVAGQNSFTEAQAKERIEAAGYTTVTGLALDSQGVWRAKAMKDGAEVDVGLDYQGNIVTQ